jgi:hypothetical protein
MILTRGTHLIQPQGPVEVSPEFGGRGVVYLPNVQSNINLVVGTVVRTPTPQGISATYTAGVETKVERLNGSAPNGITEFTQLVYITPLAGGQVNDRGLFGNRNTTGITSYIQLVHQARDASANGRYCYRLQYKPTAAATEVSVRTSNDTAIIDVPSVIVVSAKNGKLSIYHNGALQGSTTVALQSVSGQLDLQFGNYYDNSDARRLAAQIHFGAFLPRGMGDAEVAALSRNPWQLFRPVQRRIYFDMGAGGGAGTSPVSSDLGAIYGIRSSVQADSASAYDVRSAVQADSGAAFDILGPVSADSTGAYTILTSALSDLGASFDVRAAVQADSGAAFLVRGSTQADASAAYLLRGSVSSDIGGTYDILNANSVSSSLSSTYVVRGAAQADVSASFDLRSSIGAISEGAFMVRGLVSSDLGASFDVQAALMPVYADLPGSYAIEGPTFGGDLSPADIAAIRSAVRTELSAELTAIIQIQTKVDAAL